MINFCGIKGVFCTSATDYGYCCATECRKKPLSFRDVKIIGSDERELVPIVRCKECKYRYDSLQCRMYSEGMKTADDWFCADGEKE